MKLKDSTIEAQSALSQYCRDGITPDISGTKIDRLPHYRRLVFNIVKDALDTAYPISKKYLGDLWKDLQYRFFSSHACSNPQIWRMPEELIDYVEQNEKELQATHKALVDLLKFEWQEVYLYMMPDIEEPVHSQEPPTLEDIPVLEPEMQLLILSYPVHKTHPSRLNESESGQYASLAWRKRKDGQVGFMDISIFFAIVLDVVSSEHCSLIEAGKKAALAIGISDDEIWKSNLESFVMKLHQNRLIFKT